MIAMASQITRISMVVLLSRLYTHKTAKLRVTGLFLGEPHVTGGSPSQRASKAENFPFDDVIMWILDIHYCIMGKYGWRCDNFNIQLSWLLLPII